MESLWNTDPKDLGEADLPNLGAEQVVMCFLGFTEPREDM